MNLTTTEESVYNLEPISSPRLAGTVLKVLPKLLRIPIIGNMILYFLKKKNKFHKVISLASDLSILPLYYPLHEMTDEERQEHDNMIDASPLSLEELVNLKPSHSDENMEGGDPPFRHWTIYDFTTKYKNGEITPTEVVKRVIKLARETKDKNPMIVFINEEDALKEACESTKRYEQGTSKGVLDGVPIAVKDEIPVKGYHVARGTTFMEEKVENDFPPISRLRQQGAIIIGKTNQHELGLGTTGYNQNYGTPRNPYNTDYYTGGSSSGSAAAVSSGLVPLTIGTDGGGSVRIPAALCGIYGLKPTFKRVSADFDLAPSVESIGPIAGSLNDLALGYAIMSGATTDDFRHQSLLQPNVHLFNYINPPRSLDDVKIGYFKAHINDADQAIVDATMRAIEFYQSLGAQIIEIEIPHLQEIHLSHAITILSEAYTSTSKYYVTNKNDYSGEVQISLEIARSFSSCDFLSAQKVCSYAMDFIEDLFRTKVQVLISPATASVAPKIENDILSHGESNLTQTAALMKYMILGNFTGIPGLVFPIGYDGNGLPISILLQAGHWREDLLFRLAKVGEESLLPGGIRKPSEYKGVGLNE